MDMGASSEQHREGPQLLLEKVPDMIGRIGIFYHVFLQENGTVESEEDCSERSSRFNLCFTLGISTLGIIAFPIGVLFDKCGLRVTRTLVRYAILRPL